VAAFASSIFFPLTGWLLDHHSWRTTLLVLAGMLAATTVPWLYPSPVALAFP
jgi:hypothetical protein